MNRVKEMLVWLGVFVAGLILGMVAITAKGWGGNREMVDDMSDNDVFDSLANREAIRRDAEDISDRVRADHHRAGERISGRAAAARNRMRERAAAARRRIREGGGTSGNHRGG